MTLKTKKLSPFLQIDNFVLFLFKVFLHSVTDSLELIHTANPEDFEISLSITKPGAKN